MNSDCPNNLIEAYTQRRITSDEALLLEQHTMECADCRKRLQEHFEKVAFVDDLLLGLTYPLQEQAAETHLKTTELEALLDGRLQDEEQTLAESHLWCCRPCTDKLEKIKQDRMALAERAKHLPAPDMALIEGVQSTGFPGRLPVTAQIAATSCLAVAVASPANLPKGIALKQQYRYAYGFVCLLLATLIGLNITTLLPKKAPIANSPAFHLASADQAKIEDLVARLTLTQRQYATNSTELQKLRLKTEDVHKRTEDTRKQLVLDQAAFRRSLDEGARQKKQDDAYITDLRAENNRYKGLLISSQLKSFGPTPTNVRSATADSLITSLSSRETPANYLLTTPVFDPRGESLRFRFDNPPLLSRLPILPQSHYTVAGGLPLLPQDRQRSYASFLTPDAIHIDLDTRQVAKEGDVSKGSNGQLIITQAVSAPSDLLRKVQQGDSGALGNDTPDTNKDLHEVSPVGAILETDRPIFTWQASTSATKYTIRIYHLVNRELTEIHNLRGVSTTNRWQPTADWRLPRGEVLYWAVRPNRGVRSGQLPLPRFYILDEAKVASLAQARIQYSERPLTLAALYLKSGLLDSAERECRKIKKEQSEQALSLELQDEIKKARALH